MPYSTKSWFSSFVFIAAVIVLLLLSVNRLACAQEPSNVPAPKLLIDFNSPDASKQVSAKTDPSYQPIPKGSTLSVERDALVVNFLSHHPGDADHPGLRIVPSKGKFWDLSPYGHIEAKVTNIGTKTLPFVMQVEDGSGGLNNLENISVNPGETKVLKVIFGYQYNYEAGAPIDPSHVSEIFIFNWGGPNPHNFRIEEIKAAGVRGEKPYEEATMAHRPADGVILGRGVALDPTRQVVTNGAQVSSDSEGALAVNFTSKGQTIKIKPRVGIWDLAEGNQVRVHIRNMGKSGTSPVLTVGSLQGKSREPISPGAEADVTLSFAGVDPTTFDSSRVDEISIASDGSKSILIQSVVLEQSAEEIPEWLGKKPPVAGDWVQSFSDEFNGPALDYKKWNIYGYDHLEGSHTWNRNHNQRRSAHWSKNNVLLQDGRLILRIDKKPGRNNDTADGTPTDYASGLLTTYGKWTQRYGYFETRLKLPNALSGIWSSFTMFPDRGNSIAKREQRINTAKLPTDTGVGGSEFTVMDNFSNFGPDRINMAVRDNINGKPLGVLERYVQPDKDGYLTLGLLWLPGSAAYYCNGKEVLRMENKRISDMQSYLKFYLILGGYQNNIPNEDIKFPVDLTIDYVRAWQRRDLSTPADGAKPNQGDPDEGKN